jgi:hypothetical protein
VEAVPGKPLQSLKQRLWLALATLAVSIGTATCAVAQHHGAPISRPISVVSVQGNQFLRDGVPFVPLGYIFESLVETKDELQQCAQVEYCSRRLEARDFLFGRGKYSSMSVLDLARDWGANTIRFNINQAALDHLSPNYSDAYVGELKAAVQQARAQGFAVILCLFDERNRNGPPSLAPLNPKTPLDNETSQRAAELLARVFGQDRGVMLELLNEPWSPTRVDIGWRLWRDGGFAPGGQWAGERFVGVNDIIRDMRSLGAKNVIIVQGLSFSMKGFPGGVQDPLHQVAYSVHPFFLDGSPDHMDWDGNFGTFASSHPVLLTAWGTTANETWCNQWGLDKPLQFFEYLRAHRIGLIAYALDIPFTLVRDFRQQPIVPTSFAQACPVRGGPGTLIRAYFLSQR